MWSFDLGHLIEFDEEKKTWIYSDTKEEVNKENKRPCFKCKCYPTKEGHDACLGYLEGVKHACCGHGREEFGVVGQGYISFKNGKILRFKYEGVERV